MIKNRVIPRLGHLNAGEVQLSHIEALHEDMAATPYVANRTLVVLSQMFKLAERLGWRPLNSNPTTHVNHHPEAGRARNKAVMLRPDQIEDLLDAIKTEDASKKKRASDTDPFVLAAIEAGFWLGWRLTSELLPLKWEDLDLDKGIARLRDTKTEDMEFRAMPDEAVEVIRRLPRIVDNPHVFPGVGGKGHLTSVRRTWYRIRKRAGLNDLGDGLGPARLHDLRHNAVSWHVATGASLKLAGKLAGHKTQQATEIYSHFLPEQLKQAADDRSRAMREAVEQERQKGSEQSPESQ